MTNWFKKIDSGQKPITLGQRGELFAQEEYKKRGYSIVAANFFNRKGKRKGEIDFIAVSKERIIFVEVKTRNVHAQGRFGTGAESVNASKQRKLLQAVKVFLLQHERYRALRPQIDVCVVSYSEFDSPSFSAIILVNAVEDGS